MAGNQAACPLMGLPLEVRHAIFKHLAARDVKPKKLLRYWFEKKEVKELIAKHVTANPMAPAPRVMHSHEIHADSHVVEPEDEEDQESEYGDEEDDDEDSDDEDEDDEEDDEDDEDEDDEEDDEDDEEEDEDEDEDENVMQDDQAQTISQPLASTQAHAVPTPATAAVQGQIQVNDEEEQSDEEEDDTITAPPPAPVVRPAQKWRHIPNFMRITHCPPPVELLLASKQLNQEAKNWFYDVARLRINATGSFAHTSFFEEAFSQITDATFSPMENIRKVEVMFVWDTTWIRSDQTGSVEAIFPALLRQRSDFVHQILSQAPDLTGVTIHWHDSARDDESARLMLDILAPFHTLNANVKIEEHYIAADAKPHKRSIAGQRRLEFQRIADVGLSRLF
ncbi:hypothetical protein BDU57DRAFT_522106 [Ampelomyces quisqualis]|uniref:Uncharacterized protein n=1 Tax=Ampelomyces quisqualis TaxID=50730 RepID=A0A6A5QEP4_AMPQU|nr:hypothetical protein BDU57DRAFT_522106 [Ampelomyces quisqualis]